MDVSAAKTFLAICETGSFKNAAERLNVTQSAISMRVRALEDALGRRLFERSKSGAQLTAAGEQFQKHATALLRVWSHAQLEVSLSENHSDHLAVGAQISLWDGFLLPWVAGLRKEQSHIAVTATFGTSQVLMDRLTEGTIDLAIVYRGQSRPGVEVSHLMDDELVLVSSSPIAGTTPGPNYVFVNWGPEFAADHADAYPELSNSGLHLDLGAVGLNYLLNTDSSGYFPLRIVHSLLQEGKLSLVRRARRFVYPVYAAYPEERDEEAFAPILTALGNAAAAAIDWSK